MNAACSFCGDIFEISDDDLGFYQRVSPVCGTTPLVIPPPTLCPEDRKRRRLSFRNERNLYHRRCDATGADIISIYSPDKPYIVYQQAEWWKDAWSGLDYGLHYDPARSFFEQFGKLLLRTPLAALFTLASENSDYTNVSGYNKNCYMLFNSMSNQDCLYARGISRCANCTDLYFCTECELSYECINCHGCYELLFSQNCSQCRDSAFLLNCVGCSNCFCCTNLRHQEFYAFNRKLSKEAYRAVLADYPMTRSTLEQLKLHFARLCGEAVHRATYNIKTEDSSGDYLTASQHCTDCFEMYGGQNCKFCDSTKPCVDVYDAFGSAVESELLYEVLAVSKSYRSSFSLYSQGLQDSLYCAYCRGGRHLFGCVGLRDQEYCILNRQYCAEEYEGLVSRIAADMRARGEWGEFFDPAISPFGYNESMAHEFYPLAEGEARAAGFKWTNYEAPRPDIRRVLCSDDVPQRIEEVTDEITLDAIRCAVTHRPFRIVRQEVQFYRTLGLPPPVKHPDERHMERVALRRPRRLWQQTCARCAKTMLSSCDPKLKLAVYCEECYASYVNEATE